MAGKTAPPATNPRNAAPTTSRAHAEAFSGRPSDSSTSTAPTKDTVVTVATWSGLGGGGSASPGRSSSESAGPPLATMPPVGYVACPPNGGSVTLVQPHRRRS